MPKQPKGTRRPLAVRHTIRVQLAGPKDLEAQQRGRLMNAIAEALLEACSRFGATTQPWIWARRIANGVPYHVHKKEVLNIARLDVDYRNDRADGSRGIWKIWLRMSNNLHTSELIAGQYADDFEED